MSPFRQDRASLKLVQHPRIRNHTYWVRHSKNFSTDMSRRASNLETFMYLYEAYSERITRPSNVLSETLRDLGSLTEQLGTFMGGCYHYPPHNGEFIKRDEAASGLDTCQVIATLTSMLSKTETCMERECARIVHLNDQLRHANAPDRAGGAPQLMGFPRPATEAPSDILKELTKDSQTLNHMSTVLKASVSLYQPELITLHVPGATVQLLEAHTELTELWRSMLRGNNESSELHRVRRIRIEKIQKGRQCCN
ncbi:hypothetical protein TREMEDRAFT_64800 [Tremella mesenterica DSM 1558]|uniref:uncharacterized protein n=1 Tax=Tremella mesenterica (strain ATCC 24925 / CBS 8224 / DSM 1558 / NBRC 9311 / NRRL Y-6157 / RJB 2259-6 / UBC 559-6) TaxID=578456 RepID=UPI0003F4A1BC|nr:uncharacterized protein TREMEDRAFT_64800 [Tremella mesenterica DSM 1558]EIW66942.1 hypothetical protein TREMEDRAFT_64800 [Tremella mesenterica DSM 1558]